MKTLTASSKVKTKLLNPVGVAEGILVDCQTEIRRRQEELEVDVLTLRLLTNQTDAWERDLHVEVIDKCRSNMRQIIEDRADMAKRVIDKYSYFERLKLGMGLGDETFDRIWMEAKQRGRVALVSKSKDDILAPSTLEHDLFSVVSESMAALTTRATKQGSDSIEYLGKRPIILGTSNDGSSGARRMVGSVRTPSFRRLKVLESSTADIIRNSISDFPSDRQFSHQIYTSLCRTAVLSNLLVGSGAATIAISSWDILPATTGMLSGMALSVLGCILLPLGDRYLASSFKRDWMLNSVRFETSLDIFLMDACYQVKSELSECVAPYSRFVESEGTLLKEMSRKLEHALSSSHSLRSKINKSCQ